MDYTKVYDIVLSTKSIVLSNIISITRKGHGDFVTNIDLHVNTYLIKKLSKLYPEVQFFSEENNGHLSNNCWILDPIDGTTNLVFGHNTSAVSIAHYFNGEIVFGMVFNPFNDEVFSAKKGQGAYFKQTKLLASKRLLSESLIEFGSNPYDKTNATKNFKMGLEIFEKSLDIRCMRSSALAICYIAAARLDGYVEELLKPWDYAAAMLILQEAGGTITDFYGKAIPLHKPSSILASNNCNSKELFNIVSKFFS